MRRRGQANHCCECRPGIDMRHHFAVLRTGRDMARPPHNGGDTPAAFEWRALLAAERRGSRIRIGIQPGAIVGRQNDDRIGCHCTNGIHDFADVGVKLHYRVGVVTEMRPAGEVGRCIGGVVHLEEIHVHEERLVADSMPLDIIDRIVGLALIESGEAVVGDLADALGRLAGHTLPLVQVHVFIDLSWRIPDCTTGTRDGTTCSCSRKCKPRHSRQRSSSSHRSHARSDRTSGLSPMCHLPEK